jgi:hypothetical protein
VSPGDIDELSHRLTVTLFGCLNGFAFHEPHHTSKRRMLAFALRRYQALPPLCLKPSNSIMPLDLPGGNWHRPRHTPKSGMLRAGRAPRFHPLGEDASAAQVMSERVFQGAQMARAA